MRYRPGQTGYKRHERAKHPPPGQPWAWISLEMMEPQACWALTAPARRVVDRIVVGHMHHAGTMNGELVVNQLRKIEAEERATLRNFVQEVRT